MKIAFQGIAGAYSWLACKQLFPDAELLGKDAFEAVYEALQLDEATLAVLPVDNTVIGSIYEVYDLLFDHPELKIVAETAVSIQHSLLVLPSEIDPKERLQSITKVYSHPKALAQCRQFFKTHPWMKAEIHEDTAGAAKMVAESGDLEIAAIAGEHAGQVYGLTAVKTAIQDDQQNFTRFVAMGKETITRDNKVLLDSVTKLSESQGSTQLFKTSIVFAAAHAPGSLLSALQPFANSGLNLTKIESRPQIGKPWQYLFYLDFEHQKLNGELEAVLTLVKRHTQMIRVLGTYPKGV